MCGWGDTRSLTSNRDWVRIFSFRRTSGILSLTTPSMISSFLNPFLRRICLCVVMSISISMSCRPTLYIGIYNSVSPVDGLLHAQAEMGLQQVGDFGLQTGDVLRAEIGYFAHDCAPQAPTWRATKVHFSGSFAAAKVNASRASASATPLIS